MDDRRYRIAGPIVVGISLLLLGLACSAYLMHGGAS